ncbi:response regulator [soil metagenome]
MMSLLIVDDNAKIRRLLKSLVADLASAIHECSNGVEALTAYAAHQPDFVLMDIAMTEMDGITATQQITTADPAAKIIIVTNYDETGLREAAQSAGAFAYVLKDNLLDVRRLLRSTTA